MGDSSSECEPGCPKNPNTRKNPSIGKSQESPILTILRVEWEPVGLRNQALAFSEVSLQQVIPPVFSYFHQWRGSIWTLGSVLLIRGQSEVEIGGFFIDAHRGLVYDLRWYKSTLKVCFLGWIASLVVSRRQYMCVLNDQRTINGQRNNIQLFADLWKIKSILQNKWIRLTLN